MTRIIHHTIDVILFTALLHLQDHVEVMMMMLQ